MDFFLYLLKVNIAIILLYSIYRLFFRDDTFFRWKRIVLLSSLFVSLWYPLWGISIQIITAENAPAGNVFPVFYLNEIIVTRGNFSLPYSITDYVFLSGAIIYFAGALYFTFRMIVQTVVILINVRNAPVKDLFGNKVHIKKGFEMPYSFFGWIVLDPERYTEKELKEILCHEKAHVRQRHSFDVILAEAFGIFCWFNPFVRLLKKEIRLNLEYLADRSVLASGYEAGHYQVHLLQLSYSKAIAKITNNFNVSLLKKRIFMMNKKQTSHVSIWKYALLLPTVAVLVFFNSCINTKKEEPPVKNDAPVSDTVDEKPVAETIDLENVFSHVETPPQFPKGEKALMEWLSKNIKYPESAVEKGISGRVVVRFIVDSTGKVVNPEIVKSLNKACDDEAIRAVKAMPNWIPGKQGGKQVSVYYTLPVLFKLS